MKNDTRNENSIKPEFQQAEPPELNSAALLSVSGGTLVLDSRQCESLYLSCYKPNPY
jgi:hypothetical protein